MVVAACAGGELEEHTFELQVQKQSLTQGDYVLRQVDPIIRTAVRLK